MILPILIIAHFTRFVYIWDRRVCLRKCYWWPCNVCTPDTLTSCDVVCNYKCVAQPHRTLLQCLISGIAIRKRSPIDLVMLSINIATLNYLSFFDSETKSIFNISNVLLLDYLLSRAIRLFIIVFFRNCCIWIHKRNVYLV